VPSRIAFATSLTSARVGTGLRCIESSIWVAVITGFPFITVVRMICFWTIGTSGSGISTPRSPRATIVPSASGTISEVPDAFLVLDLGDDRDATPRSASSLRISRRPPRCARSDAAM
jgi:hypothetical protein